MQKQSIQASYLGVDLGGTKLLIGEMSANGTLLRSQKYPSGPLSQKAALALIEQSLDEFITQQTPGYAPVAIGVGLVGRIDNRTGTWMEIEPDRNKPLPIADLLHARYGLPCFLDNDVRSATKAEMLFGYGRNSRDFIYLNVGTGIAAGFVSDGQLITGGHFNAGEVGHTGSGIKFHANCVCGRPDCVEPVAAGIGFDRSARLLAPHFPETKLEIPQQERINVADVFALYESDALCHQLVDQAAEAIANLIMNMVRFNDPDTIVLGGGIMASGFLYNKVMQRLNPYTIRYVTNGVMLTKLDPNTIGLLGACSNAVKGMEKHNADYNCEKRA